jgi:hypothetical protein
VLLLAGLVSKLPINDVGRQARHRRRHQAARRGTPLPEQPL